MFFPHALLHTTEHFFFFCLLSRKKHKTGNSFYYPYDQLSQSFNEWLHDTCKWCGRKREDTMKKMRWQWWKETRKEERLSKKGKITNNQGKITLFVIHTQRKQRECTFKEYLVCYNAANSRQER